MVNDETQETDIMQGNRGSLSCTHDPIYIEQKEKYGVENIRYREYNAAGNNWIKRPMPIHTLAQDIIFQESDVDWRMSHFRGSFTRFIEEERKEWELIKKPGQTHPLDTMTITSHTDEDIEEEIVIR